ncbi:hypothetical protein CR513_38119, partial [Mucuna pruriens]
MHEISYNVQTKYNIVIPNVNDTFQTQGRSRSKMEKVYNLHQFQVELFYQFYPSEFYHVELLALDSQFENYFINVCSDRGYLELEGNSDISMKLVETRNIVSFDTTSGNYIS